VGAHDDGRWNDLRIFADRQAPHGEQTDDEDDAGEHARENRAADEKVGEVHVSFLIQRLLTPAATWWVNASRAWCSRLLARRRRLPGVRRACRDAPGPSR